MVGVECGRGGVEEVECVRNGVGCSSSSGCGKGGVG